MKLKIVHQNQDSRVGGEDQEMKKEAVETAQIREDRVPHFDPLLVTVSFSNFMLLSMFLLLLMYQIW